MLSLEDLVNRRPTSNQTTWKSDKLEIRWQSSWVFVNVRVAHHKKLRHLNTPLLQIRCYDLVILSLCCFFIHEGNSGNICWDEKDCNVRYETYQASRWLERIYVRVRCILSGEWRFWKYRLYEQLYV